MYIPTIDEFVANNNFPEPWEQEWDRETQQRAVESLRQLITKCSDSKVRMSHARYKRLQLICDIVHQYTVPEDRYMIWNVICCNRTLGCDAHGFKRNTTGRKEVMFNTTITKLIKETGIDGYTCVAILRSPADRVEVSCIIVPDGTFWNTDDQIFYFM